MRDREEIELEAEESKAERIQAERDRKDWEAEHITGEAFGVSDRDFL